MASEKSHAAEEAKTVNSNLHPINGVLKPKLSRDRGSYRANAKLFKTVKRSLAKCEEKDDDADEVASHISDITPEEQHQRQLELDAAMAAAGMVGDPLEQLRTEFSKNGLANDIDWSLVATSGSLATGILQAISAREEALRQQNRDEFVAQQEALQAQAGNLTAQALAEHEKVSIREKHAASAIECAKAAAKKAAEMEEDIKSRELQLLAQKAAFEREKRMMALLEAEAKHLGAPKETHDTGGARGSAGSELPEPMFPEGTPNSKDTPMPGLNEAEEEDKLSALWSSSRDSTDSSSEDGDNSKYGIKNLVDLKAVGKELKRLSHDNRRTNKTQRSQQSQISELRAREMVAAVSFMPKDWTPQMLRECMVDLDASGALKNTGYIAMNEGATPIRMFIRNQACFRGVANATRGFCDELRIVLDIPDELAIQKRQARDFLRALVIAQQKIRAESDGSIPHTQFQVGWPQRRPKAQAEVGDSDWWSISLWRENESEPGVLMRCEYAHKDRRQTFIIQQTLMGQFGLNAVQCKAICRDIQQHHKFQLRFYRGDLVALGRRDRDETGKVTVSTETFKDTPAAKPYSNKMNASTKPSNSKAGGGYGNNSGGYAGGNNKKPWQGGNNKSWGNQTFPKAQNWGQKGDGKGEKGEGKGWSPYNPPWFKRGKPWTRTW